MSHRLLSSVADSIKRNSLLSPGTRVIVALSGGADSVALLAALTELGYDCVAAHCNFHLRGDESNRDERHARKTAEMLNADFRLIHFDIGERKKMTGESTEMACRSLRYDWFRKLLDNEKAEAVAVAHHRDDNIETFFLNLLRGTGLAGLKAMNPRNGHIIRPMLDITREDVESYLSSLGLKYVTDSTNLESEYLRNRLRNIVLPAIYNQFPNGATAISTTIANLSDTYTLFRSLVDEKRRMYTDDDGIIDIASLVANEPMAANLLNEFMRGNGADASLADDILRSSHKSGKFFHTPRTTYLLDRGRLIPITQDERQESIIVRLDSHPFSMRAEPIDAFNPGRDPMTAYFDASILDGDPQFELRTMRPGDRLSPFGMKGTKKVSDIFNDAHISLVEKSRPKILTRNGEIIWVVGVRHSRLFRVGPSTQYFITVRYTGSI